MWITYNLQEQSVPFLEFSNNFGILELQTFVGSVVLSFWVTRLLDYPYIMEGDMRPWSV